MEKQEYYLFLDESKPNGANINHLCLAGVIFSRDDYEKNIIPAVDSLKQDIFGTSSIILHEVEIRRAINNFRCLNNLQKKQEFWEKMTGIFSGENITTIGASVNYPILESYYNKDSLKNKYFMVLQIVLENFVHFLEHNNGIGQIYIESTDLKSDTELRNVYHDVIANGTLFYNKNVFQSKLLNINFLNKNDNNTGLQLADFVPGTLNRKANNLRKRELSDIIEGNLYDGSQNLVNRFGFKIIP
ncbi:DUF3800 domain-containing protein [Enterococcus faecalis]|jgi:hypothetical protein|uniref:DUF3800 domain-containing protein n=1 Tax=Enterococcus TaxID=1350 RepID=UPI000CF2C579|nr:DUF3800 domain-containing protein [Enterococcus faecalis]EGO2704763.1 DUF3800 domain-containing protein [Enterococcus faecalis]EGO5262009.1 DUF3800 domain-containing protein [Enterococcus faecalis]EGQ5752949.1 DUF3800 domain-containing protein [Enterococcus faecalis]EGS1178265.1 DUF3800 domain-containing protein [Enterococcus faecalis]EHB6450573.1 DUF3800 domain-containing protein [Enterococcus faecalis]